MNCSCQRIRCKRSGTGWTVTYPGRPSAVPRHYVRSVRHFLTWPQAQAFIREVLP